MDFGILAMTIFNYDHENWAMAIGIWKMSYDNKAIAIGLRPLEYGNDVHRLWQFGYGHYWDIAIGICPSVLRNDHWATLIGNWALAVGLGLHSILALLSYK